MKRKFTRYLRPLLLAVLSLLFGHTVLWAQSNPTAQTLPYAQNFSSFTGSITTYPGGLQGWTISGSLSTTASTAAPNGDQALTTGNNATATAGVFDMTGKMGFLSTGSAMRAICLAINTTSQTSVNVSFDAATQAQASGGRVNELLLQYRVGTTGTFTNVSGATYRNDATTTVNSGTAASNIATVSVTLPSACDNQSVVQLRWIMRDISGTGTRPSFSIDNITVTAPLPSIAISNTTVDPGSPITGATNVVLQRYNLAVTTSGATFTGLTVPTAGTYVAADLTNLKLRYSADTTLDAGDVALATKTTGLAPGPQAFGPFSQAIAVNTTGYIFVTADIASSATAGNTINVDSTVLSAFTFSAGTKTGSAAAGGVQTITAAPIPVVTGATLSGTVATSFSASVSATNAPTSYAVASGSLPTGLSLNTTTGAITGTPTAAGTFTADITASNSSGTSLPVTFTFNIAKANQTITFGTLTAQTYGATPLTLAATTTASGLTVTYSSSNTSVATISGNTLTIVGAGTATITASQAGDANYNAATSVQRTLTVNTKALTISGLSGVSRVYDRTTTATLSGTPTLVGVVSGDEANVTVSGTPSATFATNTVANNKAITVTGYTLSGSAAGNYTVSQPTGLTANITAATLTVSGVVVADKIYNGNTTATLTSTGTLSGVVSGDEAAVTLVTTGTFAQAGVGTNIGVTLSITGSASANYSLTQPGATGNIIKASQTITFGALSNRASNAASFNLTATASSGLTVTYTSSNTAVATVSGNVVTIVGLGTTTITAAQAGDANYEAAVSVDQSFSVLPPSAATDYFRSAASGAFATAATWESSADNSNWLPSSLVPTTASAGITVRSPHAVSVSTLLSIDDCTVESGGTLTVTANTLTIANGTAATDLLVNGTLTLSGGAITTTGAVAFGAGATYNHSRNGGVIITATWNPTSTCNVTGMTSTAPTGLGQTFGNFTWNCTGQTTFVVVGTTAFNPKGLTTISSTGTADEIFELESGATTNRTYNLEGGLRITDGVFMLNYDNSGTTFIVTANITGNLEVSGAGKLDFGDGAGNAATGSYSGIINLTGNLSITSSATYPLDCSATNNLGQINFTGTTQTYTRTVSPATRYVDYIITAGSTLTLNNTFQLRSASSTDYDQLDVYGTLNMGTNVVNNSTGTQTRLFVYTGASIITSNTGGINTALALSVRSIQAGVNYTLNGATTTPFPTSAQLSTWGAPANVTIGANVSLNRDVTISGTFNLTDKALTLNGYTLSTSGLASTTGSIIGDDVATLTIAGSVGSAGTLRMNAAGRTLGKLTLNRSGETLTLASDLTLDASFANTATDHALILTAGTFDAGANTLTFLNGTGGNLPISRTNGTLTVGSNTNLVFGATGKTAGVTFTLPNNVFTTTPSIASLTLNRINALSLGNQSLTAQTLTLTAGTLQTQANTLTFSTVSRTSGAIDASATGAEVAIPSATPLALPAGLFSGNVNKLTLSANGTITLGQNQVVTNTLDLGTNTLNLNGFALTVQGSGITGTGQVDASAANSEVVFAQTAPLTLAANFFIGNVSKLTMNTASTVALGNNLQVSEALTLTNGKLLLGNNTLTIPATAALNGGSAASFVVTNGEGFLNRRVSTSNTVFPIGYSASAYRPLTMAMTTGVADYNARLYSGGITGTGNSVTQLWHVQRTAQDAVPVNLTFTWESTDETAPLANTIYGYMSINAGTSYAQLPGSGTKTGTNPYSTTLELPATDNGLIALSDVTVNGVLPVDLLAFTGRSTDKTNILRWETASEDKVAHFEVERRIAESANWTVIGFQKARNSASIYTVTDNTPLSIGYYRLKITDLDGTVSYSKVVTIARQVSAVQVLEVYPNPTSQEINVRLQTAQETMLQCRVLDLTGRVVSNSVSTMTVGEGLLSFDLGSMANGVYFIEIQSDKKVERFRIVKQ